MSSGLTKLSAAEPDYSIKAIPQSSLWSYLLTWQCAFFVSLAPAPRGHAAWISTKIMAGKFKCWKRDIPIFYPDDKECSLRTSSVNQRSQGNEFGSGWSRWDILTRIIFWALKIDKRHYFCKFATFSNVALVYFDKDPMVLVCLIHYEVQLWPSPLYLK